MTNHQVCSPAFTRFRSASNRLKPGLQTGALVIGAWSFFGHWSLVIGHFLIILTALTLTTPAAFSQTAAHPPVTVPPAAANQDLFNALIGSAASIDMDAAVTARAEFDPPTVPLGGRAIYRIVLTALDESVKLPDPLPAPAGLQLVAGGRGQAYQPLGGQRLQPQTTIIFHATASSTGILTMPAFAASVYSKSVTIPEASLTVLAPGTPAVREPPRLIVELPPGDVYAGQTFKVRVSLLDPGDGTVQGISQPHITGESIFTEPISFGRRDTIRYNGQAYPAFVNDVVITAMRAGQERLVAQGHSLTTRMIPGQPGALQSYSALVDSEPVTLTVKPLPKEGQLPGFTGAIGTFQLEPPKISTNDVRAGDPITLTVTLHGDGNIGRLTLPQPPFLRNWQAFPPVADSSPSYVILQRGFSTFSYTLIPLSDRIKATPAIPFSYFDPAKGVYVDLTIPPVPMTVRPAPAGTLAKAPSSIASTSNPDSDESSMREREYVLTGLAETPGRRQSSLTAVQRRWWFLVLQLLPAAALGGLWAWDRRRRYLEEHPEVIRRRRAQRGLRRQLRLARRASAAQDAAGFVTGAINALREACAPHGAANPDALVCADVLQELPQSHRQGRTGEIVRRLFAAADAHRFGGAVKDGKDMFALQPDFEQALAELKARL